MFSCSACLRRAIYSLVADLPHPLPAPLLQAHAFTNVSRRPFTHRLSTSRPKARESRPQGQTRTHSTLQSIQQGHHRRVLRNGLQTEITPKKARRGSINKVQRRDALAREQNRASLDISLHKPNRDVVAQRQSKDEWRVQNHLRDPLKLAGAVLDRLRIGDPAGALELVRASEKVPASTSSGSEGPEKKIAMENVVSWNHLMDWHMHEGDTRGALKVYNELKKRGHRPDAHTYTIMLRGFADGKNVKKPNAVRDAVSVYNSIFAANSTVTPNTIHTNAIVNVCARGGDMDALWSVTGRLAERGVGSPDKWTFTTVLNALRADAMARAAKVGNTPEGEDDEEDGTEVGKIFEQAVQDGRRLWEDVVKRWRAGDVMVDEPLACAMGRLLLISLEKRQWTDVGSLVEQTMGIGNMMSLGRDADQLRHDAQRREDFAETSGMNATNPTMSASSTSNPATNEFAPIVRLLPSEGQPPSTKVANTNTSISATPGNNVLSLLVETATLLKNPSAGKAYWDLLTSTTGAFKIEPDAQNLTAYLRLLRISRASKIAKDLLRGEYTEKVDAEFFKRGTFVIAMSTCIRDKNNPNVFDYASTVLDVMQQKLSGETVEPKVLGMYVELAAVTTPGLERGRHGEQFVPDLRNNNAMRMLARLRADVVNIRKMVKMKMDEEDYGKLPARIKRRKEVERPHGVPGTGIEDLAAVLRALIGVYDRIIAVAADGADGNGRVRFSGTMGDRQWEEYVEDVRGQKKKLGAFLTKLVGPPPSVTKAASISPSDGFAAEPDTISDEEVQKSVVGKRNVHRALREGVGQYEKMPKKLTKRMIRQEKEEKEVIKQRRQFPPSMLNALPRDFGRAGHVARRSREEDRDRERSRQRRSGPGPELMQRGWGGGFERLAEREGGADGERKGGFIEL